MTKAVTWAEDDDFWDEDAEGETEEQQQSSTTSNKKQKIAENDKDKQKCPNCGSIHLQVHQASGSTICTECGVVVEENALSFSVEFVEGAGGAASTTGQFVGARGGVSGGRRNRHGGQVCREMTLMKCRRRLQDVASRLHLGYHLVDAAHRFYRIALDKNFTKGRRQAHMTAACLYVACRQEKSQHMLIDFSDALEVNVYTLGNCFLKFRRLLGIKLEVIDPALYVYRFAAHLDLGDKTNAVALTAIRIVSRMKRDWILTGRRPAGICAAALLISARAHGLDRDTADVTEILRVCGVTVHARLKEFEFTPTARLTLDQMHNEAVDNIDVEMDPPSFTKNRFREARAMAIQEGDVGLLTSGALDDPRSSVKSREKWRKNTKKQSKANEKYENIYQQLEEEMRPRRADQSEDGDGASKASSEQESSIVPYNPQMKSIVLLAPDLSIKHPKGNNGRNVILPNHALAEELQQPQKIQEQISITNWKTAMPSHAQEEIDNLFRTDEDVAEREVVFDSLNEQYLVKQKMKKAEQEAKAKADAIRNKNLSPEEEARQLQDDAAAQAYYNRKRKYNLKKNPLDDPSTSIADAVRQSISTKKISRKINYDAMASIFDDDGNFESCGDDNDATTGIPGVGHAVDV